MELKRRLLSHAYRRYVLIALTTVYTLNFLDRNLIGLLLQPIKEDLHLSDTQLGFLTGIAFGLFYATMGLPIARWADRGNRVTITAAAIALWSVTVMSCFFVVNFVQLLFARVAAAVGESGCMPPTYSLIGDYFPAPRERTKAMSRYWLASPASAMISFIVGGWLNGRYGWRATFLVMGIPGLVVSLLVLRTVIEPRIYAENIRISERRVPRMMDVLRTLWYQKSSRHLGIGIILLWTIALGMAPWYASFMIRSHGMGTAELGIWLGLIFGVSGLVGITSGGYIVARWFTGNERGQMRVSAVVIALLAPGFALFLLLPEKHEALCVMVPLMIAFSAFVAPAFTLMQRLVVDEMRATTLSVVMLFANLIGMGIGSQMVGVLSDLLNPRLGSESLRYAMLLVSLLALWVAYHFWQVGRSATEDLSALELHLQAAAERS